jgi:hypothetical protein
MRPYKLFCVGVAILCVWFAAGVANAQSKLPAPEIIVYESPA